MWLAGTAPRYADRWSSVSIRKIIQEVAILGGWQSLTDFRVGTAIRPIVMGPNECDDVFEHKRFWGGAAIAVCPKE